MAGFLASYGLPKDSVENLIDVRSGKVLARDLGRTKRSIQQRLGVLLGLKHFATDGDFAFPQDELVELCRHHGAYDQANFAKTMKATTQDSIAVFVKEGQSWRLTKPGERYLAEVIQSIVQPQARPIQARLDIESPPAGAG
ncbi:MAG: hypothetical protein L3K19_00255 [Thermoplasmata archaeon]|nr:hypothetical protein [Thermoplasmata archaeon]